MVFWVYRNDVHHYARLHHPSCSHCNDGQGTHGAKPRTPAGEWLPFPDKDTAKAYMAKLGYGDVAECAVCKASRVGQNPKTSEAIAEEQAEADTSSLATKEDITELSAKVKTDIAGVKSELKIDIARVKSELKTDIANLKVDILRRLWIVAACIVFGIVTLTKALP